MSERAGRKRRLSQSRTGRRVRESSASATRTRSPATAAGGGVKEARGPIPAATVEAVSSRA